MTTSRLITAEDIGGYTAMNPTSLNGFRQIIGAVVSGTGGPQLIPMFGDSTMVGVGIGTGGGNLTGAKARSWPLTLARLLTTKGIPTKINSFYSDGNIASGSVANYTLYDPRVTFGAGWICGSAAIAGGFAFTFTNVGAGGFNNASSTLSFTPTDAFDSFTIYWAQRGGTANVNIDGGAALTVASGLGAGGTLITIPGSPASFANMSSTFSVSRATHTVNIVVQSGTTVDVMGVRCFDSTLNYLDLFPMPSSGARISNFDNSTASFKDGKFTASWMPSVVAILLNLTVNDIANSTTGAAYTAALADMKQFNGNGALPWLHLLGPYIAPMGDVTSNSIVQAITTYAASQGNQPVFDFSTRWRNGSTNLTGGDGIHPTWVGDSDIARYLANVIERI